MFGIENLRDALIQIPGFLGLLCSIIAFQCRSSRKIIILRGGTEFFACVQYFMLGAYTGMGMDGIGVIRNIIYARQERLGKSTLWAQIFFSLCMIAWGVLNYEGGESLLAIIAKVFSTVGYGMKNARIIRFTTLFTSSMWFAYNMIVGSMGLSLGEILTISSILIAIVRMDLIPFFKKQGSFVKNNKKI